MVTFVVALVVAVVGVAAYAHYNPGVHEVTLSSYHFAGVPDWQPVAVAAGAVLLLFLLHSINATRRVRKLRSALDERPRHGRERIVRRWADGRAADDP